MQADARFRGLSKPFWANVRTISENAGYTERGTGQIRIHSIADMARVMHRLGLGASHICDDFYNATIDGALLNEYFAYRAGVLNDQVRGLLMDSTQAEALYKEVQAAHQGTHGSVMNKQSGDKAKPAYLTNIVNMLI